MALTVFDFTTITYQTGADLSVLPNVNKPIHSPLDLVVSMFEQVLDCSR